MPFITVRKDGAVTIPIEVRNRFGIEHHAIYELHFSAKGKLTLEPVKCECRICGRQVKRVDDITGLCGACKRDLTNHIRGGMDIGVAMNHMRKMHLNLEEDGV